MRVCLSFLSLALVCHCGGEPVGSKVPKANPAHVAGAAAAAAALVTLADPKGAKARQETRGGGREKRTKKVTETVPEDVLLRADAEQEESKVPCKPAEKSQSTEDAAKARELFPTAPSVDSSARDAEPCKEDKKEEAEEAADAGPIRP